MTEENWIDLHLHTSYSDGLLSPPEMVKHAKTLGLKAIGIVDHDTVDGIVPAIEAGKDEGVEIVPGVELSSQCDGRDIHIIGYYFDMESPKFKKYLTLFQKERYKRAEKMVKNLNNLGIHVSMDEVEGRAKGNSIGRPHLAEILMEKGYIETFQEAFHKYIGYGSKAYEEKYQIVPEEAIRLISEAKGLSFLAHPGYPIHDDMIFRLIKAGLDGLEIYHPKLDPNRMRHLQDIVREHGLLISGGSDCHGGRNGELCIGKYNVPYSVLEEIKLRAGIGLD
jgi:predicted metal-dependent phosphoesterase TrpH